MRTSTFSFPDQLPSGSSRGRLEFDRQVEETCLCDEKCPPLFERAFRNALRLALEEASSEDVVRQERGWKLFLLIPRMLLHRPPRGGLISKEKLRERFEVFARGEWNSLLEASSKCDDDAAARRRKHRQQEGDNLERRAARAKMLVALGELSSARQALEGEEVAPGTRDTLEKLKGQPRGVQQGEHQG